VIGVVLATGMCIAVLRQLARLAHPSLKAAGAASPATSEPALLR
jgi:hypothetical protein